jgi:hypothetical protein
MWEDSEEYAIQGKAVRRVFRTPTDMWFDPEGNQFNTTGGTSDLEWCSRVIDGGYLAKAGWHEYAEKQYPFLIDTNIFCRHIDIDGTVYP